MPGYNPTLAANNARNGNTVAVQIGDVVVAFAQTVGHNLPMGTEQLYGIGTAKPQEIQQLRMSPQISVDSFALTRQGVQRLAGGVNLTYTLVGRAFDLHIMDGESNTTLYVYVGCKASNFSESIPTNAPVRDAIAFLAMDVLDSSGNSIMDSPDNAIDVASSFAAGALQANALGILP